MPLGILFPNCTSQLVFIIHSYSTLIPSSLVRGYGHSGTAYYIQCHHCKERFEADPVYRAQWQEEFHESEAKLEKLRTAETL